MAKKGDQITATDTHLLADGTTTVNLPFMGQIDGGLSNNVNIQGEPAATVDSTATNTPSHIGAFFKPPTNRGQILSGSPTVNINGKAAARNGDTALTCNDPVDLPIGQVVAFSTVRIG